MLINLKIDDALMEAYVQKWGIPGCYSQMKQAIAAYRDVDKSDRVLLLSGDARRAVEHVFQTTLDTPEKLVKLVQNMNTVKVGNVDMEFSQDQLERLQMQASFYGKTTEEYIKEQVAEIKYAMLEKV